MKILITGATGYLGNAIIEQALHRNHTVRAFCRSTPDPETFPPSVEIARGDILAPKTIEIALQGCDAVIHSAGLVSIWERDPQIFYRINVEGTHNVIKAMKKAGVSRMIYTSSFFALGPTTETPADENWLNTEVEPHTHYAKSKRQAHQLVQNEVQQGSEIISLYPVLIYGPGKATQGNHITKLIGDYARHQLPGRLGPGDKRMTYSYIDDVAKGHLLALDKGQPGEKYILGGEDATMSQLFAMLEEITGVKPPRWKISYPMAKAFAFIEEIRARLSLNYIPQLTRDVVEVYKHHWRYSSHKAITQLGYTRTPIKVGLLKTLEHLGLAPSDRSTLL